MISTGFYRAFEERYRGPRELIKQRLEVYLPFIAPLLQFHESPAAIDLGCGRGEWLEVLQERGFLAQGVDLDESMLEACRERALPAVHGDAITYLKSLPDTTQSVISGFHIVEHIAFEDLQTLVIEALRVLRPGGLLILETPNPENVVVGTANFYLDPTHLRPIPPPLLAFLPEYYEFERVKTLRLQESPELAAKESVGLFEVFGGVSPDYAIVAQKNASPEVLCAFDATFAKHHGVELNELANRYDAGLERRIGVLDQRMTEAESRATKAEAELATIRKELHEIHQSNRHHLLLSEQRGKEIEALRASLSWRVTAPLRWLAAPALRKGSPATVPPAPGFVDRAIRWGMTQPQLVAFVHRSLHRYPKLRETITQRVATAMHAPVVRQRAPTATHSGDLVRPTPRARQIYADLKSAIERHEAKD